MTGLETLGRDIRYATRVLRKSPVFAVTAILTLGLCIGANTAIYTVVDRVLLRPLPISAARSPCKSLFATSRVQA